MKQYYCIFDKKTASFPFPPFAVSHVEEALRSVRMSLESPSPVSKFPADYALYFQAHYDEATGCFLPPAGGIPTFTDEIVNLVPADVKNPVPGKVVKGA